MGFDYFLGEDVQLHKQTTLSEENHAIPYDLLIVIWSLYRVAGYEGMAISLCAMVILMGPMRKGHSSAWLCLALLHYFPLVVTLAVSWEVGSFTPWWAPLIGLMITSAGLFLARPSNLKAFAAKRQ